MGNLGEEERDMRKRERRKSEREERVREREREREKSPVSDAIREIMKFKEVQVLQQTFSCSSS